MEKNNKKRNLLILASLIGLIVLIIVCILLFTSSDDTYTIKGKLKNGKDKYLVLLESTGENPLVVDTLFLDSKGRFSKKEKLKEPSLFILQADNDFITLCPSPKEKIKIEGDFDKFSLTYKVEGSKESENLHSLAERQIKIGEVFQKFQQDYDNANPEQRKFLVKEMRMRFSQMMKEEQKFLKTYIAENKGSLTTLVALYTEIAGQPLFSFGYDGELYKQVLEGLQRTMPQNKHTLNLQNFVEHLQAAEQNKED
ncbi:MAG: DUF4369 domain-containing protein [Bacteroidales bacterium]|nr:DUF4369 domain-containing protein [Bacteroidales bacterium]